MAAVKGGIYHPCNALLMDDVEPTVIVAKPVPEEEEEDRVTVSAPDPIDDVISAIKARSASEDRVDTDEEQEDESPRQPQGHKQVHFQKPVDDEIKKMKETLDLVDRFEESDHRRKRREAEDTQRRAATLAKAAQARSTGGGAYPGEDDVDKRARAFRQYCRFRDELHLPGSGRFNPNSAPLSALIAEIALMEQQGNERRSRYAINGVFDTVVDFIEEFCKRRIPRGKFDPQGSTRKWEELKEKDEALQDALIHLDIKYAHWFAMRPEFYVLRKVGEAITTANKENQGAMDEYEDEDIELPEEYARL